MCVNLNRSERISNGNYFGTHTRWTPGQYSFIIDWKNCKNTAQSSHIVQQNNRNYMT